MRGKIILGIVLAANFLTVTAEAAKWTEKDSDILFLLSNPTDARKFRCPKQWKEAWCTFAENYASMFLPRVPRSQRQKTTVSAAAKPRLPHVPFKAKNADKLQAQSFNKMYDTLLSSPFRNVANLKPYMEEALKTTSCPRYLSLALAHRWEVELPKPGAKEAIQKLYRHALGCNDYSDIFRVRAGLLEYYFGNKTTALEYLESSFKAEEQREGFRALFWSRRVAKELGKHELSAKYQDELFRRYPLSYYTILLKKEKKLDPLSAFPSVISTRPAVLTARDQHDYEQMLIGVLKHPKANQNASKLVSYLASKQDHVIPESRLLEMAKIMDAKGLHRAKILLLSKQLDTSVTGLTRAWLEELFPTPYLADVKRIVKKAHPFMVMGFMRQESGFDPTIQSPAGARGLLQLMPATAKWVNGRKPMKPLTNTDFNIHLGGLYVRKNLDRFNGSFIKAAAAYNGGVGFVKRWEKRYPTKDAQLWADLIPFGETRNYVPSVVVNAYWYQQLYSNLVADRLPASDANLFDGKPMNWGPANEEELGAMPDLSPDTRAIDSSIENALKADLAELAE